MVNQIYVDMLVRKIKNGEINPTTNEFFKIEDIKIKEYQDAVQAKLESQ
ncbi:hypothetical protein CSC2_12460 [Clostridium zeae]|uniref:XkdX family protein n=1 Tax=Clostridium zeae TaxID=2759022 RepID=A0ABQ1E7M3_9CLOT|nr:hypothetical protein [Clostridium zeae]GFZ30720.1 hypothetical protein CSC2_12460 [Clostridium zeae]